MRGKAVKVTESVNNTNIKQGHTVIERFPVTVMDIVYNENPDESLEFLQPRRNVCGFL